MKKSIENDDGSLISDPLFQRLFRLFLLFSEPLENSQKSPTFSLKNRALQHISIYQAHFIINELFRLVRPRCSAPLHIPQQNEQVTFRELIELLDLVFPDRKQLEPVVDRVFDRYVSQIVNKGFVMCRKLPSKMTCIGRKSKKWKSYWCTLVPGTVFLWPLHKKTTVTNRQTIVLDANSIVHMGTFEEDRFTWQLFTSKEKYQFGHFDEIQRQHWIADMNLVIEYRNKSDLYNFDKEFSKRTENIGKEKEYSWKIALESENERLTEMLNQERRALYDEEIVRELATRLLDEERERSDNLEQQVKDLRSQLQQERSAYIALQRQMLCDEDGSEEMEEDDVRLLQDNMTSSSAAPSEDLYSEEYEICEEREDTPQIQTPQIDYLIISTQSI
uniref:PH domain-containing protein n=1 Tax=Panagrolaimus sp. JU765 TaxID=591449 RepID=A0AC34PZC7_9BILA